ncbi:hypothetical protein BDF14DRAFT_1882745 [Spinellus fusiger]|nr:hypothetical protein BDF14DRAFT_1882745 [Spinellus fusiger]
MASTPLHLCVYQNKPPQLYELSNKIQQFTHDINMEEYAMMIDKPKDQGQKMLLTDDTVLQNALSLLGEQDRLEITLCSKQSLVPFTSRERSNSHDSNESHLPWITSRVQDHRETLAISHGSYLNRKDSGISLSEPICKRQKIPSSRKLPELSSPLLPYHSTHFMEKSPRIHPLDNQRTSLSPPPPSPIVSLRNASPTLSPAISLPAISFITSVSEPLDFQLAPIRHSQPHDPVVSPARYPLSPPTSVSSPVSLMPLMFNHQEKRTLATHSSSIGQFVCDRVIEAGKICNQAFRRSYDLTRHQTTHLQNRPYCYCHQCGKKFTRLDALRRHERVQGHMSSKHLQSLSFHTTPTDETMHRSQQARAR